MRKQLLVYFLVLNIILLFFSCKTTTKARNKSVIIKSKPEYSYEQKLPEVPLNKYLVGRVWVLGGSKFGDNFELFDVDVKISRIIFYDNGRFEATSGIKNYYGVWELKQKISQFKYKVKLTVTNMKKVENATSIGIPFDLAFQKNIQMTDVIEIDQYAIRMYSKDEDMLLHFIRL